MKNNWRRCLKLCADNYSDFDGNPAPVSEPQHERDREPDANAPREADDEVGPTAVPVEHISRKVLEGGIRLTTETASQNTSIRKAASNRLADMNSGSRGRCMRHSQTRKICSRTWTNQIGNIETEPIENQFPTSKNVRSSKSWRQSIYNNEIAVQGMVMRSISLKIERRVSARDSRKVNRAKLKPASTKRMFIPPARNVQPLCMPTTDMMASARSRMSVEISFWRFDDGGYFRVRRSSSIPNPREYRPNTPPGR